MKEDNISVNNIFSDYLSKHNHRRTPERFAILEKIYSLDNHFVAEDLYRLMKNEYRVSLATIYNTLDLLFEAGLVVKHQFKGMAAQYERSIGKNIHHHTVCIVCGRVKAFSDKRIRTAIQSKKFANFESTHYSLYLYGMCKKCKKK